MVITAPWPELRYPPRGRVPEDGECHVWPVPIEVLPEFEDLLSVDERERAWSYREGRPRATYVTSRAVQQIIAAHYLGRVAGGIEIVRVCEHCDSVSHGRPRLAGAEADFNVSHTTEWLIMAVVGRGRVGADVATVTELRDPEPIAASVLSPDELERFAAEPDQVRWLLRMWARKEAAVKLTGHGLAASLRAVDVSGPVAIAANPPAGWPDEPVHLLDLQAGEDLRAALATSEPVTAVTWCGPLLGA